MLRELETLNYVRFYGGNDNSTVIGSISGEVTSNVEEGWSN
jgi:hypothetical protein